MSVPWAIFQTFSTTDANAPSTPGLVNPTGTKYSKMWSGRNTNGSSITVYTTGTLTGTFTMWGSDKPNPDETSDADWVQDTGFTATNPAGAPVTFAQTNLQSKAYHKRIKYVHTSGTGTITAYVTSVKGA